ncbi:hypothetical protein ES703_31468 [subsurface metagenome]
MMAKDKTKRVIDGDTFTTQGGNTIRLANVDTPEKGERGAPQARKDLIKLISRKPITVEPVARDKYGRIVANVKVVNKSVNNTMRKKGWK